MLSWICPDCGCDCAPTDQECPDCSDLVQAGMVALARAVEEHRDSFPPPLQFPLQERVTPPWPVVAKAPPPMAPRWVDPKPEPISSSPVMPVASGTSEMPPAPAMPLPQTNPARRRGTIPGWLVSVLVATALSLGGAALIRNMEKAQTASGQPGGTSDSNIEVTGLRVLGGPRFGAQLQYIIVNHSQSPVSNVKLKINVFSTGGRSLFTVSTALPGMAPYASREMVSEVEDMQASDIPEWAHLHAQVQVVAP